MRPYEVMFILDPVAVTDEADSYIRFTALLAGTAASDRGRQVGQAALCLRDQAHGRLLRGDDVSGQQKRSPVEPRHAHHRP